MTMTVRYAGWILATAAAVALAACGSVRYPAHYVLEVAPPAPAPPRSALGATGGA